MSVLGCTCSQGISDTDLEAERSVLHREGRTRTYAAHVTTLCERHVSLYRYSYAMANCSKMSDYPVLHFQELA